MGDDKMSGQPSSDSNVQYVQHPPPPYTMNPPPPSGQPPIIQSVPAGVPVGTVTGTFVISAPVGPDPMIMTCPSCAHQIVTRTEKNPTVRTHVIACVLLFFICWPCVCVPYCVNSCNNINHYCPNCSAYIGGYRF